MKSLIEAIPNEKSFRQDLRAPCYRLPLDMLRRSIGRQPTYKRYSWLYAYQLFALLCLVTCSMVFHRGILATCKKNQTCDNCNRFFTDIGLHGYGCCLCLKAMGHRANCGFRDSLGRLCDGAYSHKLAYSFNGERPPQR